MALQKTLSIQPQYYEIEKCNFDVITDVNYDGHNLTPLEALGYATLAVYHATATEQYFCEIADVSINGFGIGAKYYHGEKTYRLLGKFEKPEDILLLSFVDHKSSQMDCFSGITGTHLGIDPNMIRSYDGIEVENSLVFLELLRVIEKHNIQAKSGDNKVRNRREPK